MNTSMRNRLSSCLLRVTLVLGLLLGLKGSQAQTFYGSGGTINTAPGNVSNVALGYGTLHNNTTGYGNIAIGFAALQFTTTGSDNTANGSAALYSNTTGYDNTAIGANALYLNTTGYDNTANGYLALATNTTGYYNTATGYYALYGSPLGSTGSGNTANGYEALYSNTTGWYNIASGLDALYSNTSGSANIASGLYALYYNTTGYYNIASGLEALFNNTTGSNNVALGYLAGANLTTGSNNIDIGNAGGAGEGGVIRLGTKGTHTATYIAGINGVTASGGVAVYINANGQLGTLPSSKRFKREIHAMGQASARLMQLRPVTFRYKQAAEDGTHPLQYGLIAEEVAKVYPDLVQYDQAGKPLAVYYHLLTPMLLNELQKAHRQAQAQRSEIAILRAALHKQGSELAALKQAQRQQLHTLAKLTALVETYRNKAQLLSTIAMQH